MGLYDEIRTRCPKCGGIFEWQSKSGDCTLATYGVHDAPYEVLAGAKYGQCENGCPVVGKITVRHFAEVEWTDHG